ELPDRDDNTLITEYAYNPAGRLETIVDPRGIVSKLYYDALGRTIKTIENYQDGEPSDSDDKTILLGYDGAGHVVTVTALLADGYQTTEYVYGSRLANGDTLDSNDILVGIKHPDKGTGDASADE